MMIGIFLKSCLHSSIRRCKSVRHVTLSLLLTGNPFASFVLSVFLRLELNSFVTRVFRGVNCTIIICSFLGLKSLGVFNTCFIKDGIVVIVTDFLLFFF